MYCSLWSSATNQCCVSSYDEEDQHDFMSGKGPAVDTGTPVNRVVKEVKRNWWLWGAVGFALVLITGVVMFRHKLYNTGNFGLPFLAGCALSLHLACCKLSSAPLHSFFVVQAETFGKPPCRQ